MGISRAFTVSAVFIPDIHLLSAYRITISDGTLALISQVSRSRPTQSNSEIFRKLLSQALYLD